MSTVIESRHLSKTYRLRHEAQRTYTYSTLREAITQRFQILVSREKAPAHEEFFALKDISFQVRQGERIGLIGRNGAGKSTLLKILSRITEPSAGEVRIRGRVASLLEVGTGFHPELTGRENIYLNGSILGMARQEISRKFDEIVAFSEVERFLDTPVKRYSSGMYVRLAFAVAAHLESDILLVDEVLSVGDLEFRNKCLGKMRQVGSSGRTVVYVSHDMASIRQLSDRVLLIADGEIIQEGDPETVTSYYEKHARGNRGESAGQRDRHPAPKHYHLARVELRDASGSPSAEYRAGDVMEIHLWGSGTAPADSFTVEFQLFNQRSDIISFGAANPVTNVHFNASDHHFVCRLGPLPLTTGTYAFSFIVRQWGLERWDYWDHAVDFEIVRSDIFNTGFDMPSGPGGDFVIQQRWSAAP